jgi:eukaryotic-like serine/threonine-protein kinase
VGRADDARRVPGRMTDDPKSRGLLPHTERERHPVRESVPSSAPDDVPAPGSILAGKYEVERILGAGGMGVVLAARHMQLGQRVALKFMRGLAAQDPGAVERFLREARAAVSLTSEHVARVLDVGTLESGAPYMVMEYLAGVDLAAVLRRGGPLSVERAVDAVIQACEAIAEAHARGIVHRDLKPANLFMTERAEGSALVKVLDFGISKPAPLSERQEERLTVSGMVMGSPGYMSPEQVRSSKDVDARSDIWSLGVILYELLTGVSPFQGETIGDTFARITSEPPPRIQSLRRDIPDALSETIARCLERKLTARLQSVGELALRLAPFAPPETGVLVQRIARLSGQAHRAQTLDAPAFPSEAAGGGTVDASAAQTAGSWLRSAAHPALSRRWPFAAALGTGLLLCVTGGGYWMMVRVRAPLDVPGAQEATAPQVLSSALPTSAGAVSAAAPPVTPVREGADVSEHAAIGAPAAVRSDAGAIVVPLAPSSVPAARKPRELRHSLAPASSSSAASSSKGHDQPDLY